MENIESSLLADYEERAAEAQQQSINELEALLAPTEQESEHITSEQNLMCHGHRDGADVEVEACDAEELRPVKLLGHYVFPGAKEGSLHKVCVRVLYSDGSRSDYVPVKPFEGSALLQKYLRSKQAQKIHKYAR